MNIILLSGGSGKRLWPLSNDTRSKQFLKLLKNEQGDFESMVQRVHGQIRKAGIDANIVVATGASQVDSIRSQLGDGIDIVIEPERRDTFPAIALSCSYLALEKKIDQEEVVLVLPVDPYADIDYFYTMCLMETAVKSRMADLVLMGMQPTYPSAKYGYIIPAKEEDAELGKVDHRNLGGISVRRVERFTEKPTEEAAEQLIAEGAMWNGGVFAFRLGYLMDIVNGYIAASGLELRTFAEILKSYGIFKKISFDYEVVEKAPSVAMVPYSGDWKDLGTWNTLSEQMEESCIGLVTIDENTENTHVINELSIPIVTLGVKDLIVAASPDGILISDKHRSSYLKSYIDGINERPMYEEKIWGDYKALDYARFDNGIKSLTKHITLKAGQMLGYQFHLLRDEVWTIICGSGELILDGVSRMVSSGDVVHIIKGQKHGIKANNSEDIHFIEVQIGEELTEEDWKLC